jgi:glycosyltransferase involved in cell wall biosynthesis
MPEVRRDRELVFLGRLVSDKGCDVLIDALSILLARDLTPSLTIIGSGPAQETLKEQVKHLGLSGQVSFVGPLSGEPLVRLLNQHQIMVVPSRWDEPFGIVALEGIACGCFVIGSAGGGLREAIGECGVTFPNRNASALAELLHCTLTSRSTRLRNGNEIDMHLQRHRSHVIASSYSQIFHSTRDPILEADSNPS